MTYLQSVYLSSDAETYPIACTYVTYSNVSIDNALVMPFWKQCHSVTAYDVFMHVKLYDVRLTVRIF